MQMFASSLLSGGEAEGSRGTGRSDIRDASQAGRVRKQASFGELSKKSDIWGPEPPNERRPRLQDVAVGSTAARETALRAMRTASVLESHEGVNGGLDVAGNFKRRSSDEDLRGSAAEQQDAGGHLVYIHHVQPSDTYAGIVLKYRCREDAFRKANGLWSRDGIQIRKWLALPVDACEVRGRPCQPPSSASGKVDLLAPTPEETDPFGGRVASSHDDYFSSIDANGHPYQSGLENDDRPWTHVRWVSIDSCPHPVEIARVPRKALGYFPPRRKKSVHTASTLSTPRESVDIPSITLGSDAGVGAMGSPGSASSRRPSILSGRPQLGPTSSSASASRARGGSVGATGGTGGDEHLKPAWMRRPGGVGSLDRHVRAPGPERDYLNSWTKKHIPYLAIDSLPSMSVMGSEVARLGFGKAADGGGATIVESPFEGDRDAASATTGDAQGTGLDKAAAAIETWLRGAFTKKPGLGTPVMGPRGRGIETEGDLIELEDTNSEDGRVGTGTNLGELLGQGIFGPTGSGWSADGARTVRGRTVARGPVAGKSGKDD